MKIERTNFKRSELNQLMHINEKAGSQVQMGHVIIPAGARFPATGSKANPEDEYSYIVQGQVSGEIEGEPFAMEAGDFIHIPAGSQQWCQNLGPEDVHIVYTLVE